MPIRLLCCSSTMEGGGSERQMVNLLRGIDRRLISPELYLLHRQGSLLDDIPADVPISSYWENHNKPRIYFPGRISASQCEDLKKTIIRNKCDVVYDRLFHIALIAGAAAKRAGVKRVAMIVSPPQQDLLNSERRLVWLKRWILARSYRSATRLLAVSHGTAENAAAFYQIPIERFEVILSPIDIERIDRLRLQQWEGNAMRADRQKIISVGRLSEEKGHACLMEGIGIVNRRSSLNPELHLVGDGPLRTSLQKQAEDLGIADRVVFHGHVSNPYSLIQQADLFCLPSFYEGLPNALMEAMLCEVPVMASDCPGGIREVTADGRYCQLVTRGDPIAWAHAIQTHFERGKPDLQKTSSARKHIESAHSLPHWISKMEEIFDTSS